jgi:hypothetical protein
VGQPYNEASDGHLLPISLSFLRCPGFRRPLCEVCVLSVLSYSTRTYLSRYRHSERCVKRLLDLGSAVLDKSSNQPVLPNAILVINAIEDIDMTNDSSVTDQLLASLNGAIHRDAEFSQHTAFWADKGRNIGTILDLILCYYSSFTVIRLPTKGRPNLLLQQVNKLYATITNGCNKSTIAKKQTRMLLDSVDLDLYTKIAFDHFSQDLSAPLDFIEASLPGKSSDDSLSQNLLNFAKELNLRKPQPGGITVLERLSEMATYCFLLDCSRHHRNGPADVMLDLYHPAFNEAIVNFCDFVWPCEFRTAQGRCVNTKVGHGVKGHQNEQGKIIGTGSWQVATGVSDMTQYCRQLLKGRFEALLQTKPSREQIISGMHAENITRFYARIGGAHNYISHSVCLCCLSNTSPPEHPLPCGHVLCTRCVQELGRCIRGSSAVQMSSCPLDMGGESNSNFPYTIYFIPEFAGVRILSLDG